MLSYGVMASFYDDNYYFTVEAYLLMLLPLLVLLCPLIIYENKISKNTVLSSISYVRYKVVTNYLIIIGFYSLLFFIKNIAEVIAYGFMEVHQGGLIFYESSLFSKFAVLGAFSSSISIFFFFYTTIKFGYNKRGILLLISSFSFVLYTLNVAGRDGIAIWILSFISLYCLFHQFMAMNLRVKINQFFKYALIPLILVFFIITFSRFAVNKGLSEAMESIYSYIGQPLANLSYSIDYANKQGVRSGEERYPIELLSYIFGGNIDKDVSRMDVIRDLLASGFRANQFHSYIGDFYPAFPIYVLGVFIIICFSVYSIKKIQNNVVKSSNLLICFAWYMILVVGVFYFYYSEIAGNAFLLLPFIIKLLLIKIKSPVSRLQTIVEASG
jgi:hypothetical protein